MYDPNEMKFIVITGGPGAGKTAVLELIRKLLLKETVILPEAASIIFNGGFWRLPTPSARAAAQRAIFHIQNEMEILVSDEKKWTLALCDRGSLDGLAYWPYDEESFWQMCNTNLQRELSKYYAVIHLNTPTDVQGYNHVNPLRVESSMFAQEIDKRIESIWQNHPRYHSIESNSNFLTKAQYAIDLILNYQGNMISNEEEFR